MGKKNKRNNTYVPIDKNNQISSSQHVYNTEYAPLKSSYGFNAVKVVGKREKVIFYFGSTHKDYKLEQKRKRENKRLIDKLIAWSDMTMMEIRNSNHKTIGTEKIPVTQLKRKLPKSFFSEDIEKVEVLRFNGTSCRLIGVYSAIDNIFDVAFVDYSLDLYDH